MTIQLTLSESCLVKMQDAEMADGKITGKWIPAAPTNKPQPGHKPGTIMVYVSAHRRVILDACKHLSIPLQNSDAARTLRVKLRHLTKGSKGTAKWDSTGPDVFVPPRQSIDVYVGEGHGAIIEEMPS